MTDPTQASGTQKPAEPEAPSQPSAEAAALLAELTRIKVVAELALGVTLTHLQQLEATRAKLGPRPAFNDLQSMRMSCLGFVCSCLASFDPRLGKRLDAALFPDPDDIDYSNQGAGTPDLEAIYDRVRH